MGVLVILGFVYHPGLHTPTHPTVHVGLSVDHLHEGHLGEVTQGVGQ